MFWSNFSRVCMFCNDNRLKLVPDSTQTGGFPIWTIVDNLYKKVKSEDLIIERKVRLHFRTVSRLGFEDSYLCMCICIVEKTTLLFTLCAPCFRGENEFFMTILLFIHHSSQLEVTHILYLSVEHFNAVLCVHTFTTSRLHCYVFHLWYKGWRRQLTKYL